MISMLRKEACSGSTHDLAIIPTQNCLSECLTKASVKADNLITAVKTGRLLDVDIHPNFSTLMQHKAFLSTWCRTCVPTREKDVFFLNALRISLTPREEPFHMMFVRTHTYFKNQDATKLTHLFLLDYGVILGENNVFVLGSCGHFSQCFTFSPSIDTMSSSTPIGVGRVNRWTKNSAQHLENSYYEALAFSQHHIDLVFDEENMKPERITEASENASIDPGTMRVS